MKLSKEASLFSEHTQAHHDKLATQPSTQRNDSFFRSYHSLMQSLAQQYPWLSKMVFLSMVLQQSSLFFTNRKGELRDIYSRICQQFATKEKIYHCDSTTTAHDIFNNVPRESPVLLVNVLQLDNKIANEMSPQLRSHHVLAIEPANKQLPTGCFIHEDFSLCIVDEPEDNFQQFISHLNEKSVSKTALDRQNFAQTCRRNIQAAEQMKEEQGFLKCYLQLLKIVLEDRNVSFPNSRWKSLHRGLKVVGMNKVEDKYKILMLVDCMAAPWFLASSAEEYQLIQKLNDDLLMRMVAVYGAGKFIKYLSSHFWFSQHRKAHILKRVEQLRNDPTFFYPCNKFPQNVSLFWERTAPPTSALSDLSGYRIGYKIKGYDKKLMSDKYVEIHADRTYRLQLELKTSHKMLVYVGLACYDQQKRFINTIQICRRKNTEVVFESLENEILTVDEKSRQNLQNWATFDDKLQESQNFAYLRSIGVYPNGDIERILPIDYVLHESEAAYDTSANKGAYRKIDAETGRVILNGSSAARMKQMLDQNLLRKGSTVLINHFQAGTYVIGKVFNDHLPQFVRCSMDYSGFSRQNCSSKFLDSTRYVRLVMMSNFNSGYPQFQVENKQAELCFSQMTLREL